jgi:hypothetical protein
MTPLAVRSMAQGGVGTARRLPPGGPTFAAAQTVHSKLRRETALAGARRPVPAQIPAGFALKR